MHACIAEDADRPAARKRLLELQAERRHAPPARQGHPERANRRGRPTPTPSLPDPFAVGWICEDQVERLHRADGTEVWSRPCGRPWRGLAGRTPRYCSAADPLPSTPLFDEECLTAPARQGLEAHGSGAGEKIQNPGAVESLRIGVAQDVEQAFARPVGGRTDIVRLGRGQTCGRGTLRRRCARPLSFLCRAACRRPGAHRHRTAATTGPAAAASRFSATGLAATRTTRALHQRICRRMACHRRTYREAYRRTGGHRLRGVADDRPRRAGFSACRNSCADHLRRGQADRHVGGRHLRDVQAGRLQRAGTAACRRSCAVLLLNGPADRRLRDAADDHRDRATCGLRHRPTCAGRSRHRGLHPCRGVRVRWR